MYYKVESSDKLKDIDHKNRTCYYFDEIYKIEYFDLDNILRDEKPKKNIFIYNNLYIVLIDSKPFTFLIW